MVKGGPGGLAPLVEQEHISGISRNIANFRGGGGNIFLSLHLSSYLSICPSIMIILMYMRNFAVSAKE